MLEGADTSLDDLDLLLVALSNLVIHNPSLSRFKYADPATFNSGSTQTVFSSLM